jgi:hypothetical protein
VKFVKQLWPLFEVKAVCEAPLVVRHGPSGTDFFVNGVKISTPVIEMQITSEAPHFTLESQAGPPTKYPAGSTTTRLDVAFFGPVLEFQ